MIRHSAPASLSVQSAANRRAVSVVVASSVVVLLCAFGFASQDAPASQGAASASAPAVAATFEIDDTHSMALFRVQHLKAGRFWGLFNDVSGTIQYVPTQSLSLNVSIKTESIDSNSAQLDRHLKSPDFFNAVEFPSMTFVSKSSKPLAPDRIEVTGDITIRGVTKSITVPFECSEISGGPMGTRAGFEATFEVKRSDFGVSYGVEKGMLGDQTRVIISLEGVQAEAPEAQKAEK